MAVCIYTGSVTINEEQTVDSVDKYPLKYQGYRVVLHLSVKKIMGDNRIDSLESAQNTFCKESHELRSLLCHCQSSSHSFFCLK